MLQYMGPCWQHHYQRQIWTCERKSWCGEQAGRIRTQGRLQMGTASPDHHHNVVLAGDDSYSVSQPSIQMLDTELCQRIEAMNVCVDNAHVWDSNSVQWLPAGQKDGKKWHAEGHVNFQVALSACLEL